VRGVLAAGNGTIVGGITYSSRPEIGALSNHNLGLIANNTTMHLITPAGVFDWYDGVGGTRMTLNSTGLGVGVASPAQKVDVDGNIQMTGVSGGTRYLLINGDNTYTGSLTIQSGRGSGNFGAATVLYGNSHATYPGGVWIGRSNGSTGPIMFGTGGITPTTVQMTLDASGNLLLGVASSSNRLDIQKSTDCAILVKSTGANTNIAMDYVSNYGNHTIRKSGTAVWDYGVINDATATPAFKISNASSVGVQLVSGATAWTTLSDETMKDIIEPISNAVSKVGSLRSVIGKFKTDDASKRRSFLIAQDVQSVLPEAVDVIGENNELGLRYTEVIPLLVAAIQELTAEVNALKNA
jgi:hypothetical protein